MALEKLYHENMLLAILYPFLYSLAQSTNHEEPSMAQFEPDEVVILNPHEQGVVWDHLLVLGWEKKGLPAQYHVEVQRVGGPITKWTDVRAALKLIKGLPADAKVHILGILP